MNIFMREMKAHRKSLIIWCISMVLLIASGMAKYAGFSSSGLSVNDLIDSMPNSLKAMTGMGDFDLSMAMGFYGVLFFYMVLLATVHAVMLGANIISKEERDKTAEFLFVKPVSRNKVIILKMIASLVNIVILNLATLISSLLMVGNYSNGEAFAGDVIITILGMLILQILFLVVGTSIAAIYKKPKKAASLAAGLLLFTFLLSIAVDLNDKLENLKYLSPFKYFEAKRMMYGGGFDTIFVLLSVAIIAILFTVTVKFYNKRDLIV